jgi:molecular chaperone Hsp33
MPDATDEEISILEKSIYEAGAISKMLESNLSLEEIAKKVTGDKNLKIIERNTKLSYECDCSKSRMQKALMAIGKDEIKKIITEDVKTEMKCQFCNKKYNFSKEELEQMLFLLSN